MDVLRYNQEAWDRRVDEGDRWTQPVSPEVIAQARAGQWSLLLTPTRPVPRNWYPKLDGARVLGLASAGGQQCPVLASLGVGRLVVAGALTDACIRSTLHGALVRGYDTLLVSDAHTTEDLSRWGAPPPSQVIAHTNLYWSNQAAPGRVAGTATTAEVELREP